MFRFRAGLGHRLIALVAAYALALQTLLAAGVVASPGDAFASTICSSGHARGAADTPAPPAPPASRHGLGCAFCPLACAGALAPPPGGAVALHRDDVRAPTGAWSVAVPVAHAIVRAGLARAPPA
jgi:hypothetical protein